VRAVLQRVTKAAVAVDGQTVGEIGPGLVALVGVAPEDGYEEVAAMARKISELRVLRRELSVLDLVEAGEPVGVLLVSQFTLYADVRKGRRPSWHGAAPGPVAKPIMDALAGALRGRGVPVAEGVFGAAMSVELANDGPFTLVLDA
jgi:D-tyrosyl-tRNA(Tyr) deacylase